MNDSPYAKACYKKGYYLTCIAIYALIRLQNDIACLKSHIITTQVLCKNRSTDSITYQYSIKFY